MSFKHCDVLCQIFVKSPTDANALNYEMCVKGKVSLDLKHSIDDFFNGHRKKPPLKKCNGCRCVR
jgi:hypothetical protein